MMPCDPFFEVKILCKRLNRKVPCCAIDDGVFFKNETILHTNP
jgi:hypothetical protein